MSWCSSEHRSISCRYLSTDGERNREAISAIRDSSARPYRASWEGIGSDRSPGRAGMSAGMTLLHDK